MGRVFNCSSRCLLYRKRAIELTAREGVPQWHLSRRRRCTAHGRIKEDAAVLPLIEVEVRRSVFSRQLGPPVRFTCCDISVTHARSTSQLLRGKFFLSPRIYGQQSAYCALSYRFHPYITKHTNPVCVKKPLTFRGYDDTPSIKAQGKTGERTRNNVPETARHWSRASTERCSEWAYPVRPR